MKGRISNPQGDVMIRTDVIAKYAGSMAVECFGIVGIPIMERFYLRSMRPK